MQRLRLSAWQVWGGLGLLVLASSCGLASDGVEFESYEDIDASVDDGPDARPDGSTTGKDAGVDSGDGATDAGTDSGDGATDAGADSGDATTDAEAGADLDASADAPAETDSGDETDGGEEDAGPDDLDASDGSEDGGDNPIPDAGEPDAPPGPCVVGTDPCDMDCDGALAIECGGDDCCDTDPNVFVGQTKFFTAKNACGNFDYNCDGTEQKELGKGSACSRRTWEDRCNALTPGYKGTIPECGQPGIQFVGCTSRTWLAGCDSIEEATIQACR